jgi:hypothetical protein
MNVSAQIYGASPVKRDRRTKAEIAELRAVLKRVIRRYQPMTVRQVFYQLVSMGAIGKSEQEYKGTICRLLSEMRRDGDLPWHWLADNTRWQRKPTTYRGLDHLLQETARLYRRALWEKQDAYVEVWLEKDALAGVLVTVTAEWDVPLMVTRGFASLSYLYTAAEAIAAVKKPAYLYYFGDRDPSGVAIDRKIEQDLRTFAPQAEIHFERIAVTPGQIDELDLPTRPTKTSDSRSRSFEGESVEVDAIDPETLRELTRDCIERHINMQELAAVCAVEEQERDTLSEIATQFGSAGRAAG